MSAAERMRKYRERIKQDPERQESEHKKERERWKKRCEDGKVDRITDRTERGKRMQRKRWRDAWKRHCNNKKNVAEMITPPTTPEPQQEHNHMNPSGDHSSAKSRGRKKIRRDRAMAYRQLFKAKLESIRNKRLAERYRKRCQRQKEKSRDIDQPDAVELTPRSRVTHLLHNVKVPTHVRKMLLFHHVLSASVRKRMRQKQKERDKQVITKVMCADKLVKRYRLMSHACKSMNITHARQRTNRGRSVDLKFERNSKIAIHEIKKQVEHFFIRDDVSRMKTGKKDTATKGKVKNQRRILTATMKQLHKRFIQEYTHLKISYTTFTRLRPFWVAPPTLKDRETCLCKIHENGQLLVDALIKIKAMKRETSNIEDVAAACCCDMHSHDCAFGLCQECKGKQVILQDGCRMDIQAEWWQWAVQIEVAEDKSHMKRTKKVKREGTISDLKQELERQLQARLCRHIYTMRHQFNDIKKLKESITDKDAIVHIDFSENYMTKGNQEVQAAHFGGGHKQVTLHTGMLYTTGGAESFCSLSDSKRHDAPSIWAHLMPILDWIQESFPLVKHLYFLSDGPTTQYRNKTNMYLMSTIPADRGFISVNWIFTEAGHGKGAPDGVGAAVKRRADAIVSSGKDITNCADLMQNLSNQESKTRLLTVNAIDIEAVDKMLGPNIPILKGIMKIHQVI